MFKIIKKYFSTNRLSDSYSFAVIGSGPGGIYTAKHLLRRFEDIQIDFYEKLPHPFGLVRTGVSPDHQEVKNVEKDFMSLLEDKRVRFLGNVKVGKDIPFELLRGNYSGLILSYGADSEDKLNIPNENSDGVFSSRSFVNWYNGHILHFQHSPFNNFKLEDCKDVVIIGNGNVAIDIARILSKDVNDLRQFDLPELVLDKLSRSKVQNIHIVGRRGLLHAAFTIKEMRELSKVEGINLFTYKQEMDDSLAAYSGEDLNSLLPAERRHITRKIDLIKLFPQMSDDKPTFGNKNIFFRFLLTPKEFQLDSNRNLSGVEFVKTNRKDETEFINTNLVFKSTGYRSRKLFEEVKFNESNSTIENVNGVAVLKEGPSQNVFCVGWVKTGPRGIIDSTLRDSYNTAESIYKAISNELVCFKTPDYANILKVVKAKGITTVDLDDWKKINAYELNEGLKRGKIREKIVDLNKMLSIISGNSKH